jgi:hypothetical protein
MSETNRLIVQDKDKNNKNKFSSNLENNNIDIFNQILNKSALYITNQNFVKHIKIKSKSIKRILSNGELEHNEYIFFYFYKEDKNNNNKMESTKNNKIKINLIKESSNIKKENKETNTDLNVKNKNENIFDPELPLLSSKISNTFSNVENFPKKYINLILCGNKIIISLDYLKCFYLTIFFCGLFNLISFVNNLFFKNGNNYKYDNLYDIVSCPLALVLMITGIYGFKKVNSNVYDDEICINLTNISFILPICSFALSKLASRRYIAKSTTMNIVINLISSIFSLFCIIILKEAEREKNSEKNIINI